MPPPVSTMTWGEAPFLPDIKIMISAVIMENENAVATVITGFEMATASTEDDAITPVPMMITDNAAPNAAAWEMPKVKGDAKGFFNTDCITAPETASPAPPKIAMTVWGRRIFQTMRSAFRDGASSINV